LLSSEVRFQGKNAPNSISNAAPTPYDHPFPPNWGSQPPVKTCIANCGQTVTDTTVVCIVSLWEHTITPSNSTIVDRLRTPLLQKV